MYSQRQFTPGKKSNSSKIHYIAAYNAKYPNATQLNCSCVEDQYNKFVVGSESASTRTSNNLRVSQVIKYSKGGQTQYGNSYLGKPININYLGKAEGMPGGGGSPPLNKFN